MRIILAPYGSHGDFRPQLALALKLREIGHTVHFCTTTDHESFIEEHGFSYTPVDFALNDAIKMMASKEGRKKMHRMREEQTTKWISSLKRAVMGADLVIGSGVQFVAPAIADEYGVPYHYMIHTPIVFPSGEYPPMGCPFQKMPRFMNKLISGIRELLLNPVMRKVYNDIRKQAGLPPFKGDLIETMFRTPFISADENLFPVADDVTYKYHQIGYFHYFEDAEVEPGLEKFLQAGDPPVFIGFGSMHSENHKDVENSIKNLIETSDYRFVISKGWGNLGEDLEHSGRIYRTGHAPHHKIFPKMAAIVHHGGTGTTSTAAYCGVPQVIMPHGWDQFYNAHRMNVAGIAPKAVVQKKAKTQLPAAIREVMTNHKEYKKNAEFQMKLSREQKGLDEFISILGLDKVKTSV